ncbi:hypothetical protein [Methylobacterium sp. CM6247]
MAVAAPWRGGSFGSEAISGHGDHLRLEGTLIDPHAMEDDGQLARQCDAGLPEASISLKRPNGAALSYIPIFDQFAG